MPRLASRAPKYRKHPTGQAIVSIGGRVHYLGLHGSKGSKAKYRKLVAEWKAGRRSLPPAEPSDLRVAELARDYLEYAKGYYRDSDEPAQIWYSVQQLTDLYGRTRVSEFGPLALEAVQHRMIEDGLSRGVINQRIKRIRTMFRWGVGKQKVSAVVVQALECVSPLKRGRSEARETDPVKPVPDAFVDAIQEHVSPQIWAMVELQRFTGMRPGEVCGMRTCDIETTGNVWTYTPASHKTAHHGHARKIFIGPKAQAVLKPWLRLNLEEPLFQPAEAVAWMHEQRRLNRKTPDSCGNRPGTNRRRSPKMKPGTVYTTGRYGNAIRRACKAADVPHWHPHQLRHNAATTLRKEYGLDVARVVLGHRSPQITEVYAELDHDKAQQVMGKIG